MALLNTVFLLGWVVFWVYWLASAASSKKNVSPTSAWRRFVGIRIIIFFLLVIALSNSTIRRNVDVDKALGHGNNILLGVGLLLFVSGLAFAIWARRHLGKNWGMPMTVKQSPELVTSGPYHFVRHPIYTGILVAILGTALDVGTYWFIALIVSAIYFIYSAIVEEKLMLKQFPKAYPDYKKSTKMLIPFIF
jgi:isoprenylcysteine carboxyl methyltransferase (ICMT) family protein YpbQ